MQRPRQRQEQVKRQEVNGRCMILLSCSVLLARSLVAVNSKRISHGVLECCCRQDTATGYVFGEIGRIDKLSVLAMQDKSKERIQRA